ncbi:MAG TPA: ATP-binding protein [Pyrinomonadaceae bacterium]|nr:ATP-binding protein [Pyrinomonadaceae bacterium]
MDQSKQQFLAETEDLIEQIFVDLDELRESSSEHARRQIVDRLFRCIHRIKGSAASFDFEGLSELVHEFENLLSALRAGRIPLGEDLLDALESAAGILAESLHAGASNPLEPLHRELLDRIQTISRQGHNTVQADVDSILSVIPDELSQSLTSPEKERLVRVVAQRNHLFVITATFDTADFDDQYRNLKKRLEENGEVIATLPVVGTDRSSHIVFQILFATQATIEETKAYLTVSSVAIRELDCSNLLKSPASSTTGSTVGVLSVGTASSLSRSIRVDAAELDRLISATHELFRTTTKALGLALYHTEIEEQAQRQLSGVDEQVRQSFLSVEKQLIDLRTVPVGPILQRTARAGRAAARSSGKKINFTVSGESLKLDRVLCDAIADPLIQLVRNAVDHGIETHDAGTRSATQEAATVRIEAYKEGKQTCLRVTDNGRGVDPNLVQDAAIRMGIMEGGAPLDMAQCLRLLFRPGFTTLPTASTVSGRGVGLDLVETAVEQVGGEVRVSSEPGKGATFEIRLPVTVGLIEAIIVLSGSNAYCIDARDVVKSEIIDSTLLQVNEAGEFVRNINGDLPLLRLETLLGIIGNEPIGDGPVHIITCELADSDTSERSNSNRRFGIIVDRVQGIEEVLVRNLGRHAARWPGVAGATELRDGRVALVVDLPRLLTTIS